MRLFSILVHLHFLRFWCYFVDWTDVFNAWFRVLSLRAAKWISLYATLYMPTGIFGNFGTMAMSKNSQLSIEIESLMRTSEWTVRLTLYYVRKGPNSLFSFGQIALSEISLSYFDCQDVVLIHIIWIILPIDILHVNINEIT